MLSGSEAEFDLVCAPDLWRVVQHPGAQPSCRNVRSGMLPLPCHSSPRYLRNSPAIFASDADHKRNSCFLLIDFSGHEHLPVRMVEV